MIVEEKERFYVVGLVVLLGSFQVCMDTTDATIITDAIHISSLVFFNDINGVGDDAITATCRSLSGDIYHSDMPP